MAAVSAPEAVERLAERREAPRAKEGLVVEELEGLAARGARRDEERARRLVVEERREHRAGDAVGLEEPREARARGAERP